MLCRAWDQGSVIPSVAMLSKFPSLTLRSNPVSEALRGEIRNTDTAAYRMLHEVTFSCPGCAFLTVIIIPDSVVRSFGPSMFQSKRPQKD